MDVTLPAGSVGADLQNAIDNASSGDTISIMADINLTAAITLTKAINVTIKSQGTSVRLNKLGTVTLARHFTVNAVNSNLVLQNIILDGGGVNGGVEVIAGCLTVNSGCVIQNCNFSRGGGICIGDDIVGLDASCILNEGCMITQNTSGATDGGGICVISGTLTMYGGIINKNTNIMGGGGVYIGGSTTVFNMYGGEISENLLSTTTSTDRCGGGVYVAGGSFNMYSGVIKNNTNVTYGGGVSLDTHASFHLYDGEISGNNGVNGGGVYLTASTFIMDDGKIIDNTGQGVVVNNSSTVTMNGGEISDNSSTSGCAVNLNLYSIFNLINEKITETVGGRSSSLVYIYTSATFNMSGGEISGVIGIPASNGTGAVYVGGTFNLSGGVIKNNSYTNDGGGVYVGGYMNMTGGEISGNQSGRYGGGVCVYGDSAKMTLAGGKIMKNSADLGGGVYYSSPEDFEISKVEISGNSANQGGGMYIYEGIVIMTDSGVFSGNTAENGGGGIVMAYHIPGTTSYTISGSYSFINNSAKTGGGAIFASAQTPGVLSIGPLTVFLGNTADTAYTPPANAATLYPNIGFATTSILDHPLNNYDINYTGTTPMTFFTVTFDSQGGSVIPSQSVLSGELITNPTPPTLTDYIFGGWYTDNNTFLIPWNFATNTVVESITLYAKWIPTIVTVTFDTNGGTPIPAAQTIAYGGKATLPTEPALTGYSFGGWFLDDNTFTTEWDFTNDAVTATMTLYAKWNPNSYTVTFNANGGAPVPAAQTIANGGKVTLPTEPILTGSTFGGWFLDDNTFANRWDFTNNAVTGAITLYAKWNLNTYTVTFNTNGGAPVPAAQTIAYGGKVTLPTEPALTGYALVGWFTDDETFTTEWDFATGVVTKAITLYAEWIAIPVITFTMKATPGSAKAGKPLTYTLTFANNGAASADNAILTDALPAVLSNPEYSMDNGVTWQSWNGSVSLGSVADGSSVSVLIRGTVSQNASGSIVNTATVDFTSDALGAQSVTANLTVKIIGPRDQAITDMIESVAMQEAALAHILNAEGEKMQAMIAMDDISFDRLMSLNGSVTNLVTSVTRLEMLFQNKLSLFNKGR